jgi:hypothetical protein
LARRFNIADSPSPAPSLAPEVFPVIIASDPSAEESLIRGIYLSNGGGLQAAGVGAYSHFRLANIAGSQMLVILENVVYLTAGNADVAWGVEPITTLYANAHATGVRDTRITPSTVGRQCAAVLSSETNITLPCAGGKRMGLMFCPSSVPQRQEFPMVIAPGTSFNIGTNTANITLYVYLQWRERRAQPSELG